MEKRLISMKKNVLVSITVSREKEYIVYKVDCSSELLNEELEYYLQEIIKGICTWKPEVCEEKMHSFKGEIKKRPKSNATTRES
jgi:hypothetical protein